MHWPGLRPANGRLCSPCRAGLARDALSIETTAKASRARPAPTKSPNAALPKTQVSAEGAAVLRARDEPLFEADVLRALPVPLTRLGSMRLERPSIGALAS